MNDVIVKCFKTRDNYYFYDRFTNSIVKVSKDEYDLLKQIENNGKIPQNASCLSKYFANGFLERKKVMKIKHPLSDEIEYHAENKISQLILQVTQQCNLRCSYCAYSGNYYNREHSDKKMSLEIAYKAIDFYFDHSNESDKLVIAFYGGEPLLEFSLIKKCVEYAEARTLDKELTFYITTNGTLLSDEIITFLVQHKFALTISLDGKKEEHDVNRKFRSGKGSFDVIIQNLKKIKKYDQKFFSTIRYNTVINPQADLKKVLDYFGSSQLFDPRQVRLSMLTDIGVSNEDLLDVDEKFWIPYKYENLKVFLNMTGKLESTYLHPLCETKKNTVNLLYEELHYHSRETVEMHHGGPCIPGIRRLFINTTGKFYPCERVSESLTEMEIGSLEEGFDYEKIYSILNIGKLTEKQCIDCWNLRLCKMCVGQIEPVNNKLTTDGKLYSCAKSMEESLYSIRELCVLIENGYHFREEDYDG